MDITVRSKNCDIPTRVRDEAIEKITHATRFFDRLLAVELVFAEEANPRIPAPAVVELTARTKGHQIRAQASAEDHRAAVDAAVTKFESQLSRYKTRLVDRRRGRGAAVPASADGTPAGLESPAPAPVAEERARIVRRKRFPLPAMLPEEAALQLELLDHDFYLFVNKVSGECNLIYRRRDGDLGLIEPVLSDEVLAGTPGSRPTG